MLCHVKMFMRSLLGKKDMGSIIYMYIITQMSDISKPHEFYKKIGFNLDVLPQGFNSWNVVDEQMAYVLV